MDNGEAAKRVAAAKNPARKPGGRKDRGEGRAQPAPAAPHAARRGALRLLAAVREGVTLAEGEEALADLTPALTPAERARARRLAAMTLRHRSRSDAVLAGLIDRRPRPEVMELLQLAVTEMLAGAEAPHGAVNAAVALARSGGAKAKAAAGMVNAVLRRAAERQAAWDAASPPRLPDWLRRPVVAQWGEDIAAAIEAAHERGAALDLTPRAPGVPVPGAALPTGSHRLQSGAQVTALPGYAEGDWWVQDAAAALPVRLLAPRPGETVADLCAAPGGKTMQLAAAGARVTAIDLSPQRLARLAANLARVGLEAETVAADALGWTPSAPLDAVLLDAPCSATGTIRRHPELPLIRDGAMIPELVRLQAQLINHAAGLLKPGGRLVYAVCSLHPAEGEGQLATALARHPGLAVEPPAPGDWPEEWITPQGAIRTRPDHWPELGGLDGFFIARLRRCG
ncbi:RsmB/NOP family class I SAM-dependent RNA methyltransferase [Paracoccus alkenifer]|uniref:RsmB/NOP family class I SAM-dependent RNA methyltransferase n=1 Tax=Paracoccus alkenifer TaxID=65735 RepID=UPI002481E90D|nr:RsmB/NOP family class I SAM-dependent RNA methyltransferase [Paracoccus alkenifer]